MRTSDARLGLLGKAPRHADFIRFNASSRLAHELHLWMEAGVEGLVQARGRLTSEPICFVFTAPGDRNALVGCLAPSVDRVGRDFPLAVFAEVDGRALASRFALVPVAFRGFLGAAAALLKDAGTLELARLQARVSELPLPDAAELAGAEALHRKMLVERTGAALLDAVGRVPEGVPSYATRTFLAACTGARGREPQKTNVILDCPLPTDGEPGAWLELASRLLRWSELPPSFFWSGGSRLLLCLGPALPSVLSFLADPARTHARLWPLRTQVQQAILAASRALTPVQNQALTRAEEPLENLLRALAS